MKKTSLSYVYLGRHNTYYFRFRTPAWLLKSYPNIQKEFRRSLMTGYQEVARNVASQLHESILQFCEMHHSSPGETEINLVNEKINKLIQEVITMLLYTLLKNNTLDLAEINRFYYGKPTIAPRSLLGHPNPDEAGFILLGDGIRLKELQGETEQERELDYRRYKDYILNLVNKLPVFKQAVSMINGGDSYVLSPASRIRFKELTMKYAKAKRSNGWEDDVSYKQGVQKLAVISELIGENKVCGELTTEDADQFLEKIQLLPKNANKGILAVFTLEQKLRQPEGVERLSKASISKYVALLQSVSKFGVSLDRDKVGGINPLRYDFASHLVYKFNKKTDTNSYLAFSKTELTHLISGHVYQPELGRKRKSDNFIFWAPLLAMYTGARVNEIAQLLVSDIKQDKSSGIWYINILSDDTNDFDKSYKPSVKTQSSRRKVPIHPVLIDLGFLAFAKMQRQGENAHMLFHTGITYYDKGKYGKNISDWFNGDSSRGNGYKVSCGIERNSGKVFHSFRHTFAQTLLSKVGEHVDLNRIGSLIGHEELKAANASKITLIYTQDYPLEVLYQSIGQLDYGIDLSSISFESFLSKHKKFDELKAYKHIKQAQPIQSMANNCCKNKSQS